MENKVMGKRRNVTLVRTDAEFRDIHPYGPDKVEKKDYPERYPCFCWITTEGGGICGEYRYVNKLYPPPGCDLKSFQAGLEA